MMEKITGVLNALQGIYGKGFILAGFLPICLLLGVLWFLGCCLSAGFVEFTEYLLGAKLLQQFAIGTLLLFLISIASFVFWQLNSWFLRVFEGRVLPLVLQDYLSAGERNACTALDEEIAEYREEAGNFRQAVSQWEAQLVANSTGLGATLNNKPLQDEYDALRKATEGWQAVRFEVFRTFFTHLETELRKTEVVTGGTLEKMRDQLSGPLVITGRALAERDLYRSIGARNSKYPVDQMNIGPSLLANVQEAQRADLQRSYGIDIGVFWSSLQKIAAGDEKFAAILENSKARLDFSVALAALSAIFTLCWLFFYGLIASSWTVYLIVAGAAIVATIITRQLVLLNYQSFAETVRTTVELFRFELLKSMHVPLPLDSDAEKQTWIWLAQSLQVGNHIKVTYAPPEVPPAHA
jgi:hypothetical protein